MLKILKNKNLLIIVLNQLTYLLGVYFYLWKVRDHKKGIGQKK